VIAESIKEVYRDLLSEKDKAFQEGKQRGGESSRSFVIFRDESGDMSSEQKMPKFKGLLSIGVDELSNTLIVSAPAFLFDNVCKMVHELDEAAAPTSVVEVVKLGRGIRGPQMQRTLAEILGESRVRRAASSGSASGTEKPQMPGAKPGAE
jgi:hypothetical protein